MVLTVATSRFYRGLAMYCLFLSLLMFAILELLPVHYEYEQTAAFRDALFDSEFQFPDLEIKKTFDDAMVEAEMWQWVRGPFYLTLTNGQLDDNRLVGAVQVRQVRVVLDSGGCDKGRKLFRASAQTVPCYPEWSADMNDRAPFAGNVRAAAASAYAHASHFTHVGVVTRRMGLCTRGVTPAVTCGGR